MEVVALIEVPLPGERLAPLALERAVVELGAASAGRVFLSRGP
jgi:hypothetical protein